MKDSIKIFTALFVLATLFVFAPASSAADPIINGSFENGFDSWETVVFSPSQSWNIGTGELQINAYTTFSGDNFAYYTWNGDHSQAPPSSFEISQTTETPLPVSATLSWSMAYNSVGSRGGAQPFDDSHFFIVGIQEVTNGVPGDEVILFSTLEPGTPTDIIMTEFTYAIADFDGKTVRIFLRGANLSGWLDIAIDNFTIAGVEEPDVPPGWYHGKKEGWNGGSTPPGLHKKGKTPKGFEKNRHGAKKGWKKVSIPSGLIKKGSDKGK